MVLTKFCGQCGADLRNVSPLAMAALKDGVDDAKLHDVEASWLGGDRADHGPTATERRVTASNQTWMGRVVDGRFRVIDVIGRGGMGVVYKVEHLRMSKIAAMKVLHADLAGDPDVVRRFELEAAAVSRLDHPNTVQVFDFGTAQGALYLIMEYVRGQDLGAIVTRDGPLPWARAAPLFFQICGALGEAHDLGIVHRDLKPENVLVSRAAGGRDFAKVLDFGLAKLGARDQPPPTVTDKTEIVGTPYFMSPEQIRGDEVDERADLYSMGALMYTVLTGEHVFTAKNAVGVLTKHLTAEVVPPSARAPRLGLDPRIDALILRALDKDPAARWPTANALGAAIEALYTELVGDLPIGTASRSFKQRAASVADEPVSDFRLKRADLDQFERGLRRRTWVLGVIGGVAAVALAGLAVWMLVLRSEGPATREREPNQDVATATPIGFATEVTGQLGKRLGPREPDRDLYRVLGTTDGERIVDVHVSAIPNIDLVLTLRDATGQPIAVVDEGGVGAPEAFHRRRLRGGIMIEVGEAMATDQAWPIENVSDDYTLRIDTDDAVGWEIEPDGTAGDATPLGPGQSMRGWLDARADVDVLRWDGPAGAATVEVAADPSLPVTWRVGDGPRQIGAGKITVALAAGDRIWLERADRDRPRGQPLPGEEQAWTVTVTPAR
jgi:serine/threonine-protein kinase